MAILALRRTDPDEESIRYEFLKPFPSFRSNVRDSSDARLNDQVSRMFCSLMAYIIVLLHIA